MFEKRFPCGAYLFNLQHSLREVWHAQAGNGILGAIQRIFHTEPHTQQVAAPSQQAPTSAFVPSLAKNQGAPDVDADPRASSLLKNSTSQLAPAIDATGLKGDHEADHPGSIMDAFKASDDNSIWLLSVLVYTVL